MDILTEALPKLGDIFVQFANLETVILETGYGLEMDDVQSLVEVLREMSTAQVQHRTGDEAHKLALRAKKSSSLPTRGVLSPFWCLQEHVDYWEYW